MPIVDVQVVSPASAPQRASLTRELADALGAALAAPAGRVWVRLAWLPADHYAENGSDLAEGEAPVFVTMLHADPPEGEARVAEATAIASAVGACVGRGVEWVHVEYAPAGRGRIAFGGKLLA